MSRIAGPLAAIAVLGLLLAGCAGAPAPQQRTATVPSSASHPTTTVIPAPAIAIAKVPTGLEGKTMADAKAALARAGFTHVVVAGGTGITGSTEVTGVTHAGESLAVTTKIVLTGQAPEPSTAPATTPPGGPCTGDQCDQCQTDGCANPRHGRPDDGAQHRRGPGSRKHPGYCAVGDTGTAVRCENGN